MLLGAQPVQSQAPASCRPARRCLVDFPTSSAPVLGRMALGVGTSPAGPTESAAPGPGPELAFLLSAALPGAGQFALAQRRWLIYGLAEVGGWLWVIDRRAAGGRLRTDYHDLAWEAARSGVASGPRVEGDFDYYETLSNWTRSGVFDRDPSRAGVQPETAVDSFNGSIWELASGLFSVPDSAAEGHPGYDLALAYYENRAYGPTFLWDWSADSSARARFSGLITRSDDAFQNARVLTGIVVANHVISAVDAFVSARLRQATGGRLESGIHLLPWRSGSRVTARWLVGLRLIP